MRLQNLGGALGIHSRNASPAAVEVAHEVSREFHGRLDLDIHYRLEQGRLRRLHGSPERLSGRQFECQFGGIDIVIGPVIDGYFEIHHGKPGKESPLSRFDYPFFHGRDIVLGNRTAEYLICELELCTSRERLHFDPAVAELPVSSGLFFVTALNVRRSANGFTIGNFGGFESYINAVTLL